MTCRTTALGLALIALIVAPAAHAQTAPAAGFWPAGASTAVAVSLESLFGLTVGLDDMQEEVDRMASAFRPTFETWGARFYAFFFAIQFMLIGVTMVVKGPFAIASYRPVHFLNPFANFFFFLLAGALGYLFVSHSYWVDAAGEHGWVLFIYDFFRETGQETGCSRGDVLGFIDNCNPEGLASIGMRLSGAMMVRTQESGNTASNPINWIVGSAGASTGVFGAFSVLAIQLALTEIAFKLAIVTAPLFLATIVFRPFAGISTGYLNFILYLGVKLFTLYLVAGLASYVAGQWLQYMITQILVSILTGVLGVGSFTAGGMFSFNLSVLTMSMLFLALTLYLPAKIAHSVSGHFNLDLNAVLFRGELPIAID